MMTLAHMTQRLRSVLSRSRELLHCQRLATELDEELRFHLEREIEQNLARGMSPEDAQRAANLSFGGVQRFREEARDARGFIWLEGLAREFRLALRRINRAPVFSAGVIGTLAIGLGAATGIGALVYGVMLRPLPYPEPDRLVRISVATPGLGTTTTENSSGTFVYFRDRARSFSALGAYLENEGVTITEGDAPERVTGAIVTPNLFGMLGTKPAIGRLFRDDDALVDPVPVLLSYDLWQRRFGGDSGVVGKRIELNRSARLILGVLPRGYDFPSRTAAVYYPDRITAKSADLDYRYLTVVGRLRPGVTIPQAQTELAALVARMHETFTDMSAADVKATGLRAIVQSLRAAITEPVRAELTLLAIMIAVMLLIATANVATLCLLRAERLRGQVAVSRALGASQSALTRRFVVEGLVVALAGAVLALPIGALAVTTKFGFTAQQVPRLHDVTLSPAIVGALLAVSVVIGLVLGALSAARTGGRAATLTLRSETRAIGGRAWRRAQEGLVSVQIALALTLLLGAALMTKSLTRLQRVDIGFAPRGGTMFSLTLPYRDYETYQRTAGFHLGLIDSLRTISGVTGVAGAMQFPLTVQLLGVHPRIEADRSGMRPVQVTATANMVSADFFRVMGMPLRAGRTFAPGDLANSTPGVVISTSLAHELFGNEDPIGKELRYVSSTRYPPYRVIGVCGDVYGERIADGVLRVLYFPLLPDTPRAAADTALRVPFAPGEMHFVVRSDAPASALGPAFRRAVSSIDPRVPIWNIRPLDAVVAESTSRLRLTMLLLSVAAGATLILGAIGLYSIIAYAVGGRTPEFAVRLALGATPRGIMRLVLREGAYLVVVGLSIGVALSFSGTRLLRGILFEVSATDPSMYAAALMVVVIAAGGAMFLPARRAGAEDPAKVLRGP